MISAKSVGGIVQLADMVKFRCVRCVLGGWEGGLEVFNAFIFIPRELRRNIWKVSHLNHITSASRVVGGRGDWK